MKILIAPLNWGLGHATRCIPLVQHYLDQGDEVVLGGDGDSLLRLRQAFPALRFIPLAPLAIRYSRSDSQVGALLRALPHVIRAARNDRRLLEQFYADEGFDMIVSDNRFGLFSPKSRGSVRQIYMTHQLYVRLPRFWRWAEGIAYRLHRLVWQRFDEVWVPDYAQAEHSLSGALSHSDRSVSERIRYIGPLSRLHPVSEPDTTYDTVLLLSGPEPQRTLLEQQQLAALQHQKERVLVVRGRVGEPMVRWQHDNITLVPHLPDHQLAAFLQGCHTIICRSGYSSVMDLAALGVLEKAHFCPTPGQSEQEYLAAWLQSSRTAL